MAGGATFMCISTRRQVTPLLFVCYYYPHDTPQSVIIHPMIYPLKAFAMHPLELSIHTNTPS